MAYEYIQIDELNKTFQDAIKFMKPLHEPLYEFERIARNKPHPGIAKDLPKVTDGTLAALIQETPKRIIQQIPTGHIETTDRELEIIAGWILQQEIIPNSTQVGALIQKCWAAMSKGLTYGGQPAFVQFINRGEYFGTDFTLPYIKDVLLEPGKLSDRDSNVIFMRTWWTKNQIDAVIYKEKMLGRKASERGEDYESGWDLDMLASLKDEVAQKDVNAQNPVEKGKLTNAGFIEIVHAFQRGVGANFYSFSPRRPDGDNIVRTRVNKDPRGQIPIHFLYANLDFANPIGRGAVEIAGGLQNLLDSEMQMYQYNRALMLNPPMVKKGTWSKTQAKYAPNAIIDLGTDVTASLDPLKIDSTAIQNFPNNYGLLKSQIISLNNSADTTIAASTGNASSKTPQGVADTQERLGISDNYLRRQFEDWFEEVTETMINLYFAERSGNQELQVDVTTADKLKDVNQALVGPDNKVLVEYDSETPKMRFRVDPTSSNVKDNAQQVADLQEILQSTTQSPYIPYLMQSEGKELHIGEVYIQLFERLGIKDLDKIVTDLEVDPQTGEPKRPAVMTPFFDKPKLSVDFRDLPPAAQVQALANGGIDIQESDVLQPNIEQIAGGRFQNPVQPAYVDPNTGNIMSGHPPVPGMPYVDPSTGQPIQGQNDVASHPLIQLMTSLQIKFTDLDPTAQQAVLNELGITSDGNTPSTVKTQLDQNQQLIDVAKLQQDATKADNSHKINAANTAVKIAEMQKPEPVYPNQTSAAGNPPPSSGPAPKGSVTNG